MGAAQTSDADVQRVYDAIRDLPVSSQETVSHELAEVAVAYQRTHDVRPVERFLNGLIATARLHRNPRYLKAVAEADATERYIGPGMDGDEVAAGFDKLISH